MALRVLGLVDWKALLFWGGGDYVVYLLFLKSAFLVVCRSHGVEFILLYIIHPSTHSHLFMKWSVVSLIRY